VASPDVVRIGIVAGEASGDQLGAGLITSLRQKYPDAIFEGLGGPKMQGLGFHSLFPMDRLSVMGLVEPLKRLPELLRIRKALYNRFIEHRFDLVVGIDSPDFNLGLELKLRQQGVVTAHYVSPSVWAWRQGRVKKIAKAVDHMLCLFPFERDFYLEHQVPVTCVGHPLADEIPLQIDGAKARNALSLPAGPILAIMPGSRQGEVAQMTPLFLAVATQLLKQVRDLHFVIPSANEHRHEQLTDVLSQYPELPVTLIKGNSHDVMAAADAVLLTSGTTALEAMLLKKPMVVAYRMGKGSYWLLSKLVKSPFIALPNLIAGRALVPEFLQDDATIENLKTAVLAQLTDSGVRHNLIAEFSRLHGELRCNASARAAEALGTLIEQRKPTVSTISPLK
jgi:lipid-A-disaccharide synthase